MYNRAIQDKAITKYPKIRNGDKLKYCYLTMPNSLRENVISYPDYLPKELGLHKYVDYETMYQKTFMNSMKPILDAIGWTSEDTISLEDFFG